MEEKEPYNPEEPETQQEESELTAAQAAEQSGGLYCDELLTLLSSLDFTNEHEHNVAHRIIDLITTIQELHKDLNNPPASPTHKDPSFTKWLDSILSDHKKGQI